MGNLNLNESPYKFDFIFDVNRAYLHDLGLVNNDLSPLISFNSKATGTGSSLDEFTGDIDFRDINYSEENKAYFFDSLVIHSISNDVDHQINLSSKFFTLDMKGNFHFNHFSNNLNSYFSVFFPSVFDSKKRCRNFTNKLNI